jgi:RNA polymerase sigma factor (sigma-70 family)
VRRVCRRFLCDRHADDDVYRETFLVLLRKAHGIGKPELVAGWLYRVASRIARRHQARAARRQAHEQRAAAEKGTDVFVKASQCDLGTILAAELNQLPEKFRSALILYYWEGKTSEEVARQLGCPTGSMSWRLGRGRELLRQRISEFENETAR